MSLSQLSSSLSTIIILQIMLKLNHFIIILILLNHLTQMLRSILMGFAMLIITASRMDISSVIAPGRTILATEGLMTSNFIFGDTMYETSLQIPKQISTVIDINIKQGKQVCYTKQTQPQPQKNQIITVKLNQTIINKQWNVQIIASTFNPENNQTYILLDNGTIIQTAIQTKSAQLSSLNVNKLYSFQAIGSTNTWLTNKYQLFLLGVDLYVLENEQFSKIQLHSSGYWIKDRQTTKKQTLSVKQINNSLFVLLYKDLYKLTQTGGSLVYNGSKLISFACADQTIYILDEENGLISLDINNKRQPYVYNLQQISKTKSIQAIGTTLFIIYQLDKRSYIAQYFIIGAQIHLNRYYYNYYSIRQLHLHEQYGVIDSYNEFTIFRHSINRNLFEDLTEAESIYKSRGEKIVNIKVLQSKQDLSFLITFKDKMEIFTFKSVSKSQQNSSNEIMNALIVQCFSDKSARYPVQIVYRGICSDFKKYNPQTYLCEQTKMLILNFEYNHRRKRSNQDIQHLINSLILILVISFSFLFIVSKVKKWCLMHDAIKQKYDQIKRRISSNSTQAEQTFNNDIK